MKLTRVTITGADEGISPEALLALSVEYPFAEWGVLRGGEDRDGTPRFPRASWVQHLSELVQLNQRPQRPAWSLHLCGELARHAMAGSQGVAAALRAYTASRVQLNGFSQYRLPMLALAQQFPEIEFILQTSDLAGEFAALELEKIHSNVVHLLDASGGRGIVSHWAERPESRLGYAGGIGPDNVVDQIRHLLTYTTKQDFWIDMESAVRTDDRFDLAKVRRVLELAKPFVEAA
jgi:phosphoribosylanthranilate isomerase